MKDPRESRESVDAAARRARRYVVVAAAAVGALTLSVTGLADTAQAMSSPTVQPALALAQSVSQSRDFEYTGAAQQWTVPADVSSATFDVYGAQGGGVRGLFSDTPGGRGGD